MQVEKLPNGDLAVNQKIYIDEILDEFSMRDCRPAKIPMKKNLYIEFAPDDADPGFDDQFTHQNY